MPRKKRIPISRTALTNASAAAPMALSSDTASASTASPRVQPIARNSSSASAKTASSRSRQQRTMRKLSLQDLQAHTSFLQDLLSRGYGYRAMLTALETEKHCTTSAQTMRTWASKRRPGRITAAVSAHKRLRSRSQGLSWTEVFARAIQRQKETTKEEVVSIATLSMFPPRVPFDIVLQHENWLNEQALMRNPLRPAYQTPCQPTWNIHALLARSSYYRNGDTSTKKIGADLPDA